jgi:hypothetical protein
MGSTSPTFPLLLTARVPVILRLLPRLPSVVGGLAVVTLAARVRVFRVPDDINLLIFLADITACPDKFTWGVSFDDGPGPYSESL